MLLLLLLLVVLEEGFNGVGLGCRGKTTEEGLPEGIFVVVLTGLARVGFLSFLLVGRKCRGMERNEGGETS